MRKEIGVQRSSYPEGSSAGVTRRQFLEVGACTGAAVMGVETPHRTAIDEVARRADADWTVAMERVQGVMGPVYVEYFSDPLCCWCWAFEGVWRQLQWNYNHALRCRLRMVGLFGDVSCYHDPINDIHNPKQMAPQWMEVGRQTGVPLNPALWQADAPSTSIPACVAVKAAAAFGERFQGCYLRRLREAAMLHARNISRGDVLKAIATETNADMASMADTDQVSEAAFVQALANPAARAAFKEDMQECRTRKITRYPSLLMHSQGPRGLLLVGYRPLHAIVQSLHKLSPHIRALPQGDLTAYVKRFQLVTLAEIGGLLNCTREVARSRLVAEGLGEAIVEDSLPLYKPLPEDDPLMEVE